MIEGLKINLEIIDEELIEKLIRHEVAYKMKNIPIEQKVFLILKKFFEEPEETEKELYERLDFKYRHNGGRE